MIQLWTIEENIVQKNIYFFNIIDDPMQVYTTQKDIAA